ncbi:F-box protein skip16 [Coemansia sp. RSA 1813]|nr:F-box protein skip16 [Coemansia sp. RSA 1646]KAJ1770407.1 F-box protein skip16 [Coemansia sp. RSA 1843]KAJ2088223.1 F-box protein skip16 [Coemansia sp. RSA 986]KAJ2215734.1 F-box protein skip16 [Coemansia sp. RSA 487]KAJ2566930.1 F-box protein skip16 [Coemansia sp. RSA 1813]
MVCREWRALASNDAVWGALLQSTCVDIEKEINSDSKLQTADPTDQSSISVSRNKRIYAAWHQRYYGFTDSYTRMRRAILRLESWASANCEPLMQSLAPGLAWMEYETMPVRELLGVVSDSPAMRDFIILYHFHDGQRRRQRYLPYGLFGSYECYGEFCSLSWLSSRMLQVINMGKVRLLIFAWCHTSRNYLGVVIDCAAAHINHLLHHVIQMQPQSYRFVDKGLFGDFFVNYVDELVSGSHDVHDGIISMFPNRGPHTNTSISHGIRTTVSAMFCTDETPRFHVYRYEVTFELLSAHLLGCPSAQIKSRRWLLHYANNEYAHSGGAGVVGQFPIISNDEPYYRYCARLQDEDTGMMILAFEGQIIMVPGSLDRPQGPEFSLDIPYTELPVPMEII